MKFLLPKVTEQRPDDVADFKTTMKNLVTEISTNFTDYRF